MTYSLRLISIVCVAMAVVCFTGCTPSPSAGIGELKQVKSAADNDAARGLGMKLWKFKYTLEPGNYDTDVWLEQRDTGSTRTKRLTHGKSSNRRKTNGGNIVVSLSDPATTRSDKNMVWRVGVSRQETVVGEESSGSSGDGVYLLKNPFLDVPGDPVGAGMYSAIDEAPIELGKPITLIWWAGGTPVEDVEGVMKNARTVYLKMEIMPQGELMPE